MKDDPSDQTDAYAEYFEAVKNLNRANDEYRETIAAIANNKKLAIQKAIEIQINPVLSRTRAVQLVSAIALLFSIGAFAIGFDSVTASSSPGVEAPLTAAIDILLVLGSLGAGILSLVVVFWASIKISGLNASVLRAQTETNKPSVD